MNKHTQQKTSVRIVWLLALSVVAAAGSGCGQYPLNVGSAWAMSGEGSSPLGSTFLWVPPPPPETENTPIGGTQSQALVQELVEDQLVAKGYERQLSGASDFLVTYRAGFEKLGDAYSQETFEQYTQGTLRIYVVNPQTNQWVWRAWAQARLNEANSPEVRRERLGQAIRMMFKDFPARGQNLPVSKR